MIGAIALFIGYLPGGLIGTVLRFVRGDGIWPSPAQRSLAAFAAREDQTRGDAPPPGHDLAAVGVRRRLARPGVATS